MNLRIITVLIFALISSIILIFVLAAKNRTLHTEKQQVIKFNLAEQKRSVWYKNNWEKETIKVGVLDLSLRNARALASSKELSVVKQFEGVNRNLKNLESVLSLHSEYISNWKLPTRDTTINGQIGKVFSSIDSMNRVIGITINDTTKLSVQAVTDIDGVAIWRRKHKILGVKFGKKEWEFQAAANNPKVHIRTAKLIRVVKGD